MQFLHQIYIVDSAAALTRFCLLCLWSLLSHLNITWHTVLSLPSPFLHPLRFLPFPSRPRFLVFKFMPQPNIMSSVALLLLLFVIISAALKPQPTLPSLWSSDSKMAWIVTCLWMNLNRSSMDILEAMVKPHQQVNRIETPDLSRVWWLWKKNMKMSLLWGPVFLFNFIILTHF